MKIIHVIPFFFPDNIAGTETYCWSLCKFLIEKGVETEVLIPNYHKNEYKEYYYDGIKVVKYPEPSKDSHHLRMGIALPEGIRFFKEYLQKAAPDVVHFHAMYGSNGITVQHLVEAKSMGFQVYYTMHLSEHVCKAGTLVRMKKEICSGVIDENPCAACSLVHQGKPSWMAEIFTNASIYLKNAGVDSAYWNNPIGTGLSVTNRIEDLKRNLSLIAENCDKICLYSKWFYKLMIENGVEESKLAAIPPALPHVNRIEGTKASDSIVFKYPSSIKLIFASRISKFKGLHILLKALQGLPEDRVELSIYGKEDSAEYLKLCKSISGKKENIHWRGVLSRDEIISTFKQHDMFCLPSTFSEMSPLVIQESFEAGIPIIASKVYGNMEHIRHKQNGLLFDFNSVEDFAKQLKALIEMPHLLSQMKSNIKPPIKFDEVGEIYLSLYQSDERSLQLAQLQKTIKSI
jgi:glycosyltransferase involved in cell wall biosynthesis